MKTFETCSCDRDYQKCVRTGITFLHNDLARGGDAFYCRVHKTINIFGIPEGHRDLAGINTTFTGFLLDDRGGYMKTEDGGLLTLGQEDIDYILKWDGYIFEGETP